MDRNVRLKKRKKKKEQNELYVSYMHTFLPLDSCLRTDDLRKDCVGDNSQDLYRVREQRGHVGRNVVA